MKTSSVARLALVGLLAVTAGSPVLAQEASDDSNEFTQPRDRRERARNQGGLLNLGSSQVAEEPPKLGVYVDVTDDGIVVDEVMADSLAEAAGVQASDILLSLAGHRIVEVEDIRAALAATRPGDAIEIAVIRDGAGLVKLTGQLAAREREVREERARADGHQGGFLGVQLGESTRGGVLLEGVVDNTAAWYAGLEGGDVLVAIDGQEVSSGEEVAGAIASRKPGSMIQLTYLRDGDKETARVRLGSRMPEGMLELRDLMQPGSEPFGMALPHGIELPRFEGQGGDNRLPMFFRQGDDQGALFFGDDGNVFEFDADDLKDRTFRFKAGGHGDMNEWVEKLTESLDDLDIEWNSGQPQSFSISIQDGKVTIEHDGETQTYDVEGASATLPLDSESCETEESCCKAADTQE